MENNEIGYIRRVDAVRTALMAVLILSVYRLPLPLMRYASLLCGFAPCALFALYGYFVLCPGKYVNTRKENLVSTLKVFLLLLGAYLVLGCAYQYLYSGNAFSWLNTPNLLTFLVFSKWPINVGESIWMIQTVLYALIFFVLFRKLPAGPVLDGLVCAVLLLLGIVFGELAVVLKMPFYLERNFLTTTIPYMLLGKLLWCVPEKPKRSGGKGIILLFCGGVVLCAAEALWLRSAGALDYCEHLIGYIPMTVAVVLFAVRGPQKPEEETIGAEDVRLMTVYRLMYYLYDPIAEFYFLLTIFLIGFPKLFTVAAGATAVVTLILTFLLAKLIARIRWR